MIASGLESLAEPGTALWAELAILLSFEVGVLFLLLGVVRAGFVVNFLGHPTILGFNAAAGLITVGSQLRPFLGIPRELLGDLSATKPWPILMHLGATHLPTLAVAAGSLLALVLMRRYAQRWPYYLIVCVAGIVLAWALDLPSYGVEVVGEIPRGLPMPSIPQFELDTMISLLPAALSILVVGYASSMTVVKALEAKARGTVEPNRELLAFGVANLASGLFGSFPVSSGLARSTVVAEAGARTRMTGLIAALGVLFTLLVAGALFEWLPRAVLAAIVMLAASGLVDVRGVREVFRIKRADGYTAVLTFAATMVIGLEVGLVVGVIAALVFFVGRTMRPHTAELGRIPGTSVYRNVDRVEVAQTCPQAGLLRIDAPLYYANARFLEDRIAAMMATHPSMKLLALDFAAVSDMDATAVMSLQKLIEALRAGGSDLHVIGAIGPVRDLFVRSRLLELLGEDHVHRNLAEAAPKLVEAVERGYCEDTCRASAFPSCTLIPRAALVRAHAKAARFQI
jgi:SulP family sulfate permease